MIDLALALYLLLFSPAQKLWQSRHGGKAPATPSKMRHLKTIVTITILLAVLGASCVLQGRDAQALGLAFPLSTHETWGLVITTVLLTAMALASSMASKKLDAKGRADYAVALKTQRSLPQNPKEFRWFVLSALFIGAGWEILYRGFLLLILTPLTGVAVAVILSALAYGCAHGYKNPGQLFGSVLAALLFTTAFALTHSLWWLMLLHAGLPLVGAIGARRAFKMPDAPVPSTTTE